MNTGCSSRHATHQEAKTLTSDTSPWRSPVASPRVRPLTGGRLKSGTGLPISVDGRGLRSRLRPIRNANPIAKKITAGPNTSSLNHPGRGRSGERAGPSAAAIAGMSGAAIALHRRVHLRRAFPDLVDRQLHLRPAHARCTGGHAGQIDPGDLRLFGKEPHDDLERDVAADDIPGDQRYVAGVLASRDAVLLAHCRQIVRRYDLHGEPVFAEIGRVAFAAIALRVLVKRDRTCAGRLSIR